VDLNTVTEFAPAATAAWRDGDAWLGGGTWLFSQPQPRLRRLLDLHAFRWTALSETDEGLRIAATCTLAELRRWRPKRPAYSPGATLGRRCCDALLGSFKVQNVATVGGNICLSLPAGPMTSLTAALDGVCTIWSADGSERRVPVADFVTGPQQNVLKAGELLRRIDIPASALIHRVAFRQISLARIGRSAALLIGAVDPPTGEFVLTVTASTPRPIKFSFNVVPSAEDLQARIEREIPASAYFDDIHGAPAWRRHMTLHFAKEIRDELAGAA
jgi:CO/xanthine dehydrogenase FAD-binding subunit